MVPKDVPQSLITNHESLNFTTQNNLLPYPIITLNIKFDAKISLKKCKLEVRRVFVTRMKGCVNV